MNIGDILVSQFGYNCSLVRFYKIIKTTSKSVKLQELKWKFTEHDGYGQAGKVVPTEITTDNVFSRKIKNDSIDEHSYVKINDYEYASKWNGNPVHYDSYD